MSRFSATLMDHFQAPRNRGKLEGADAVGVAGLPGQGRYLVLYLKVEAGRVSSAAFDCHVCGVTIACGSVLTELVVGRAIDGCRLLTATSLIEALDGIPGDKQDRAGFVLLALTDALEQLCSHEKVLA
jgi:NifU-like protein involved in Fe-S cluster formation